jgi:hypothetical protein
MIKPTTVLVDRRGVKWRTAPEYQDHNVNGVGWLAMVASNGEQMTYADVVNNYGFQDDRAGGKLYLIGYIE